MRAFLHKILSLRNAKNMHYEKFYVDITVRFSKEGGVYPESFEWFGNTVFIDKVTDRRKAPPEHVGAFLTERFLCLINGKERKIFYEREADKWFVEARCTD